VPRTITAVERDAHQDLPECSLPAPAGRLVKCVVWDLDDTVWPGVAAELTEAPAPSRSVVRLLTELERRGVVNSIASRNDPSLLESVRRDPDLRDRFVAPQVGWEPKSQALQRIARDLNLDLEAVAFVDNDAFERAEVRYLLPEVLVLAPEEVEPALSSAAFPAAGASPDAVRRVQMYREEEGRRAVQAGFAGSRVDFLRHCAMRLGLSVAVESDLPRLLELASRAHQLHSTGEPLGAATMRRWMSSDRWLVLTARLRDRFGDYGTIGLGVVDRAGAEQGEWLLEVLVASCRVDGRGIPAAVLRWLMGAARGSTAPGLRALFRPTGRNVRLAMLFRQLGFSRIEQWEGTGGKGVTCLRRDLSLPLPELPAWLEIEEPSGAPRSVS
jgi:methoxymalonate biosynthesis protein